MSSMVQDCLMGAFKSSANDIKMAAAQKFNYIISRSILYILYTGLVPDRCTRII